MAQLKRTLREQLEGDANTADDWDEAAGVKDAEQNAASVGAAKGNAWTRTFERIGALASVASPSETPEARARGRAHRQRLRLPPLVVDERRQAFGAH